MYLLCVGGVGVAWRSGGLHSARKGLALLGLDRSALRAFSRSRIRSTLTGLAYPHAPLHSEHCVCCCVLLVLVWRGAVRDCTVQGKVLRCWGLIGLEGTFSSCLGEGEGEG